MSRDQEGADDSDSIQSVSANEQLSFWSLTVSFMLKLVALGITIFILPYNEWIVLDNSQSSDYMFMRGIVGSDCVQDRSKDAQYPSHIDCVRWAETGEGLKDDFWSQRMIVPSNVRFPTAAYRTLFYVLLVELAVYVFDLGATLAMCCRYRTKHSEKTVEKRLAVICFAVIALSYFYVMMVTVANCYDFLLGAPPFNACLGNAFRLFLAVIFLFNLASFLIFYTEFYRRAAAAADHDDGDDEATVTRRLQKQFRELFPIAKYGGAQNGVRYTPASKA